MKITIIVGSHQQDSQSHKVGKYLQKQLHDHEQVDEAEMIDLGGNPIPLWDNTYWQDSSGLKEQMKPYMDTLAGSDGYIIIAPEWGGMVPGSLKNFMLYWSQKETGHKPAMLVGVSGGINGAYPIAELRSSGYKNSKIVYTPEHIIVRSVNDMMNDHDPEGGEGNDKEIRQRSVHALDCLVAYCKAFTEMRKNTKHLMKDKYPFGM